MNLYRSSSFFGRRSSFGADHNVIDLTGPEFNPVPPPVFIEIDDDDNPPPPPAPPAPPAINPNGFRTIHTFLDTTVAQDPILMDDMPIREHLAEDPADNITLLWKIEHGHAAINFKRSYFTRNGENGFTVYQCRPGVNPNMFPFQYNMTHVFNKPYIDLSRVGVPIGGFLEKKTPLFRPAHQIYLLKKKPVIGPVAAYSVVQDQNPGVHCQEGSGGHVYKLVPVNLGVGAAFGRRRSKPRRRRSSSFGRRRSKPRRRRSSSFGRRRR